MKRIGVVVAILLLTVPLVAQQRRALTAEDVYNVRDVRDPQRSPDGRWVAYTVTTAHKDTDKNNTDVWMVSWDGTQQIQLTNTPDAESSPRWSPDGKYLSFVSSRQGAKGGQVWLMHRAGGEAFKLTDVKPGVSDHAWSPDSKRLVLVVEDPDPADKADLEKPDDKKTPKPIVIDRYRFKADIRGFLRGARSHLYLFDVEAKKAEMLTAGSFEEEAPAWSPDGKQIAFIRSHGEGESYDRMPNADVFVVEARPGAQPKRLTTTTAEEGGRPAWSPDGKSIAYLLGDEVKFSAYDQMKLAVIPAAGGQPRVLTEALDRPVSSPTWTADGGAIAVTVVDDRAQYLALVTIANGRVVPLTEGRRVVTYSSPHGPDGNYAVLASTATELPEIYAREEIGLRKLTHHNDEWMKNVMVGTTEDFTSTSKDGTVVNSVLVKPAAFDPSRKYPLLLRIHGGPNGQDAHSFNFERELFAANGYLVLSVNYRGSNGRGNAFQKAIFADWGNREVVDLLGAMDAVQKLPFVDSNRLGIGGWSYGGILTNYTIAQDTRFKAAISGAGSSNQITMYGSDMYITQYEQEIGPPWKNQDLWIKISYPFFHADRIKTPTLFMVGEKDFNVPLAGSEQMYQALRSLGVDTQLVIYPNQFHGITMPSYRVDRLERYLAWYGKYLHPTTATTASSR